MDQTSYLYVEDDPLSRDVLNVILTRVVGAESVWMFEDSANFMARVRALPAVPNVILLDIHMQPLNGFEVLDLLRGDPAFEAARIVAVTASVMNEEVSLLRQKGFDAAVAKPLNVATFPGVLERIVRGENVWHIVD